MPKFPSFPPWGRPRRVWEPEGYRSRISDENELADRIAPELEDERMASQNYYSLAELADFIGRPDIAAYLRDMSEDEHRHMLSIKNMLDDLRGGYGG